MPTSAGAQAGRSHAQPSWSMPRGSCRQLQLRALAWVAVDADRIRALASPELTIAFAARLRCSRLGLFGDVRMVRHADLARAVAPISRFR